MRTLLVLSALSLFACDKTDMPTPALDLSFNPFLDMSQPVGGPSAPTCNPPMGGMPMSLTCPTGTKFYSSATTCGCFPTGSAPANPNPDPGYDESSCNGDLIIQCNPGCSFCVKSCNTLPPGCHLCTMANPC